MARILYIATITQVCVSSHGYKRNFKFCLNVTFFKNDILFKNPYYITIESRTLYTIYYEKKVIVNKCCVKRKYIYKLN